MRLNRRKNRGSESSERRPSRRSRETPSPRGLRGRSRKPMGTLKPLARVARSVAADALGIARELLRWPARIWMTDAEELGKLILAVWRRGALPAWRITIRMLRVALAFAERRVTPARGLTVVALAATIALGGSQFSDYRAVEVGGHAYASVEDVAQ